MTKQFDVTLAIKALAARAWPRADLIGFEKDASKPSRIGNGGTVIGHPGDPGDPEVDLSPPLYHYDHRFYLELAAPDGAGGEIVDAMLASLGVEIAADRTLGGLCDRIEALAPERNDRTTGAVATTNWVMVAIIASYATSDPLV